MKLEKQGVDPISKEVDSEQTGKRYWAFISYSHSDRQWGDWLHRALERYPIPKDLVGRPTPAEDPIPKRFVPVFRDREELPTASDLGEVIQRALRNARFLVVICSPRGAKSQWVNQEIVQFKQLHGEDRVLCLIVEGEPWASDGKPGYAPGDECFPKAVRHRLDEDGRLSDKRTEPIAADAREHADGKANAVVKLMAGLLGVGFDDLRRREQEYQRRKVRRFQVLSAVFALLFISAVVATVFAVQQKREVQRTLSQSELQLAVVARDRGEPARSLAHLARSLRANPGNRAAALSAYAALAYAKHPPFVGPALRHEGEIADAFGTADGKHIITASDRRIFVFSRPDHGLLRTHEIAGSAVTALAEWPEGGRFVAGTEDGRIHFLNTGDFQPFRKPLRVSEHRIGCLAWDPTGGILGVGIALPEDAAELVILAWDGTELFRGRAERARPKYIAWSPDSGQVALGGETPFFYVLTATPDGPILKEYQSELSPVALAITGLDFTGDRRLRVVDVHAGLQEWNTESGEQVGESRPLSLTCSHAAFSEDGSKFLGTARASYAILFDAATGSHLSRPMTSAFTVSEVVFLDADHALLISETGVAQVRRLLPPNPPVALGRTPYDYTSISALAPDASVLATAWLNSAVVQLTDPRTLRPAARPIRFPSKVQALTFLEDGEVLAALGWDGRIHRTDWRRPLAFSSAPEKPLVDPIDEDAMDGYLTTLHEETAPSPDGSRLAIRLPREVLVIDVATTAVVRRIPDPTGVSAIAWSPDGRFLALANGAQRIRIVAATQGESTSPSAIRLNTPTIQVAWSPDQGRIAALSNTNDVKVFDLESGEAVGSPFNVAAGCEILAWDAGASWLLTADIRGVVTLWDPETGFALGALPKIGDAVFGIYSSAIRDRLLYHADGFVALAPFPDLGRPPSWLPALLEAIAGRRLDAGDAGPSMDPDAWLQIGGDSGEEGPWLALRRWLVAAEFPRAAAPGAEMLAEDSYAVARQPRTESELEKLHKQFVEAWNTQEPEKQAEALALLREAARLDPDYAKTHRFLARVAELRGEPEDARDAYLAWAEAGGATLLESLEAKVGAARACLLLPEPDPAMARSLLEDVLAVDPGRPEALRLWASLEP